MWKLVVLGVTDCFLFAKASDINCYDYERLESPFELDTAAADETGSHCGLCGVNEYHYAKNWYCTGFSDEDQNLNALLVGGEACFTGEYYYRNSINSAFAQEVSEELDSYIEEVALYGVEVIREEVLRQYYSEKIFVCNTDLCNNIDDIEAACNGLTLHDY